MTEQEFKKYIYDKAEKVDNKNKLDELLKEVINCKEIDYGKIVYAISGCMLAVANYIDRSEVGGITGFQASFIGWEMVRKFLCHNNKTSLKIIDYDNMLYPQYDYAFEKTINRETWERIQKQARVLLEETNSANPSVIEHWKSIDKGIVPFGYKVKENE